MPGSSPCGIGGTQNPGGPCTGTYGQQASQAGAHVFDGVHTASAVSALLAAGALLAALIFAVWAARKVATFFQAKEAARKAEVAAAERHRQSYYRDYDMARYGQTLHDLAADEDAEDDMEDDTEVDLLEHDDDVEARA